MAAPVGAINGWGIAADFYDSVGVNVHADHGPPYPNFGNPSDMMADLAELGIRHIRDGGNFTNMGNDAYFWREQWVALRARNKNLPNPTATDRGQPIFAQVSTVAWGDPVTGQGPFNYAPNFGYPTSCLNYAIGRPYKPGEWMYNFAGGSNGWGHYDGQNDGAAGRNMPISHDSEIGYRIPDDPSGQNTDQFGRMPFPWRWSEPELAWADVGGIGGPNEPGGFPAGHDAYNHMKPWLQGLLAAKNAYSNQIVGGPPRVVNGRIVPGNQIRANQIPLVGIVVMSGDLVGQYGDLSKGSNPQAVDFATRHPYWTGVEPSWKYFNKWGYGTLDSANYSGQLSPFGGTPANAKPWFMTEFGHIDGGGIPDFGAIAAHAGYWPTPADVNAEYFVRQYLLNYLYCTPNGANRTFCYQFYDEFGSGQEGAFGWLYANRIKKPGFWAMRNMLALVGFRGPSEAKREKLAVTPSGFPSLPDNVHSEPFGVPYWTTPQTLDWLQLQTGDNEWQVWFIPNRSLWNREQGNWNGNFNQFSNVAGGRRTPSTETITVTFSPEVNEVAEACPTSGLTPSPTTENSTWADPNAGQVWTPKTISANSVTMQLAGYTKVLRFRRPSTVVIPDPAEPPILLPVTKGPYASGTSFATATAGAVSGDVVGLQAGTFNWGAVNPPAGVTFQGASGGASLILGEMRCTNAGAKFRNLTIRAAAPTTQKSVLEIDANGVEVDWCDIDGNGMSATTPKPSVIFIGGISIQVQNVKIRHSKVHGVADSAGSQSHCVYVAFPGPGCTFEQCWLYDFSGYGLHFNTNGTDLFANRCVIDDSAFRGAVVFDTESGAGPQNNVITNCVLTAANGGGSGIGAIHVVRGINTATNNRLAQPGVTSPGTGVLSQANNLVVNTTFSNLGTRDYRVPGNANFQFIPGPGVPAPPADPPPTVVSVTPGLVATQ